MDVVIKVRTSLQAVAAVEHGGLNKRQQQQLLTAIANTGSVSALVEVAHLMGPKRLMEVCTNTKRMQRLSVFWAGELLERLPVTRSYASVRKVLIQKFLRQPIRNWIADPQEQYKRFWCQHRNDVNKIIDEKCALHEYEFFVDVVLRSRLPDFARTLTGCSKTAGIAPEKRKALERCAQLV
jgi:hypothetical protein